MTSQLSFLRVPFGNSSSLRLESPRTNYNKTVLPYDVMNIIFDYLSHITDSGFYLEVNNHGNIRLMIRPSFTGIYDINRFKHNVHARYVQLIVRQWVPVGSTSPEYKTAALEQPYRTNNQGISNCCYIFNHPETGDQMVAYVESRKNNSSGKIDFHQGCVYYPNDETHILSGFSSNPDGTAILVINPFNMIWDANDDDDI